MNTDNIIEMQREFFESGATLSYDFRKNALIKLRESIYAHEEDICSALKSDLGRSDFEGFMCEIGTTLTEIKYVLKNLKKLMRNKKVKTPMSQFAAKSYIKSCPLGNVLIMSPWNYPFLLTIEPLVAAIAAGNTAIVKPSAYSPATSKVVKLIIEECFAEKFVAVVTGGRKENAELLCKKFDLIFFTGSQNVGREVLRHAAETLTPVVLELGGKSPCIVDETAKIGLSAKRIVFGKYLNCGQTCVAPDYILCHESVKDDFVKAVTAEIKSQFSENPLENENYGKIISEKHFQRLVSLIDEEKVVFGGSYKCEQLKIEPTVMDNVELCDAVMQEEIFGPIMPIITYKNREELYEIIGNCQKPLALYLFTEDKSAVEDITARIRYGGGCINDTIIHLVSSEMPFGGVGESGMGAYHGKYGFDTFSHKKAIVDKKTWIDLSMRYQPYTEKNKKTVIKYMK